MRAIKFRVCLSLKQNKAELQLTGSAAKIYETCRILFLPGIFQKQVKGVDCALLSGDFNPILFSGFS